MRRTALPLSLAFAGLFPQLAPAAPANDWKVLFDGKSLAGWKANEHAEAFALRDGELVVHGDRGHLFYVGPVAGAQFRNFELEVEALTRPGANSGVFFHTRWQDEGWPAHGYEAQVNSTHGDEIKSGSLYGVVKVNPAPTVDDRWYVMNVRVVGRRITVKIDGRTVVDWLEPEGTSGARRLSSGTFALQAHDPASEVRYRAVRVKPLPDGDGTPLTRADRVSLRRDRPDWWDRMDYGPFLTSVVDLAPGRSVNKGITVELTPDRAAALTYDTDLLLAAAAWPGELRRIGTPFDGAHGPQPRPDEAPWFTNPEAPGWSDDGNHLDQRPIRSGPIARSRGRWLGLSRNGDDVVLHAQVGRATVHEHPSFEAAEGVRYITREFELSGADHPLSLLVCEQDGARIALHGSDTLAWVTPAPMLPATPTDRLLVLVDRTDGDWSDLAMGAPLADDALTAGRTPGVTVRTVAGFAAPNETAGSGGNDLPRLADGELPGSADEPGKVTFFDAGTGRIHVDLQTAQQLTRIDTFSWHRADRAPQKFALWGHAAAPAADGAPASVDPAAADLAAAGFVKIADVDSTRLGEGGKHGSCITNLAGTIGTFRHLLFVLPANAHEQGTFLAEVDLFRAGDPLPLLKEPRGAGERRPLLVALTEAPAGTRLVAEGERLRCVVPAGGGTRRFKLALTREAVAPAPPRLRKAADLVALARPGRALWPERLTVQGVMDTGTAAWVVDDVPVPFDNPWQAQMRFGGFDFFSDGRRAALCTWNGDVWIVSGLDSTLGALTWKRFAAGLFETLGLKIVDDVILVNGRDQITRLVDLNGDDEADRYECFNNDICTTRNFHEFSFDLQTDRDGNFYFAKGGPVKGGGRGFDPIVPHNGTVLKLSRDGSRLDIYSSGLRAPNGIGVSPDGQVTAGDNEGTWVPHCKLHWLRPGSFQGVVDTAQMAVKPDDYNPPLCWFPMGVDNSGGGQTWVTSDRWGPLTGELLHLSYGQSSIYVVSRESIDGQVQGGVVRLPVTLGSSAMRGRFSPRDGQLWVCGLRGWQTNAARLTAFQRVRFTGAPVRLPKALWAVEGGLALQFTTPLDPALAGDVQSYALEQWNYVWGPMYGSPEVSVRNPDPKLVESAKSSEQQSYQVHDKVAIRAARLVANDTVLLEIPDLRPAMQCHLKVDVESMDGAEMVFDLWHTIHRLGAMPPGWVKGPAQ